MKKSDNGNWEYTEEGIKNFTCIDEKHHIYISVSDTVGYTLKTSGEKYYWNFYLNGGSCLFSKDFDTEEESLAWFEKKFKPIKDK